MKASNMSRADFVTSIGLIVFGVAVLLISIRMPRFQSLGVNPYSVPGIVPGFLGVIVGVLGIVFLVRSVIRGGFRLGITRESLAVFFTDASTRRLLLTLAVCLVYAYGLLGRMPYLIATILFIFAFIVVFEWKRGVAIAAQARMLAVALLVSGVAGASVWAVFRYLFLVNLPG